MVGPAEGDVDPRAVMSLLRGVFGPGGLTIERVADGVSTYVYRVYRRDEVFYLRILPKVGETFSPEVRVHAVLRARGVRVPRVVYFEPCHAPLCRSVMLTTAIVGRSIEGCPLFEIREVLTAAGRDLALVATVPVDGFGFVRRDGPADSTLQGRLPSHRAFALERLDEHLTVLAASVLSDADIGAIRDIIHRFDSWLDVDRACLAHGDFLLRHVFEHDRRYSGLIDFSAIRGASPLYDLARFLLHDGKMAFLPSLLEGYRQVTELPAELTERLRFECMLLAIGPLARHVARGTSTGADHPAHGAIRSGIETLACS